MAMRAAGALVRRMPHQVGWRAGGGSTRSLTVRTAQAQLAALPEWVAADAAAPVGKAVATTPAGDAAALRALGALQRVGDIAGFQPVPYRVAFACRAAAAGESCVAPGAATAALTHALADVPAAAGGGDEVGAALALELNLAAARAAVAAGGAGAGATGMRAVTAALKAGLGAGSLATAPLTPAHSHDELIAGVTLKLGIARAHALGAVLQAGDEHPLDAHAAVRATGAKGEGAKGESNATAAPAAEEDESGNASAGDLHVRAAQQVLAHVESAANLLASRNPGTSGGWQPDAARFVSLVHLLAVGVEASLARNVAAGHLLHAWRLVAGAGAGAGGGSNTPPPAMLAQSRIGAAHTALTTAAKRVTLALAAGRDLSMKDAPRALAAANAAALQDLALHGAALSAAGGEAALLSGLWSAWVPGAIGGVAPAAAAASGSAAAATAVTGGPLFPLHSSVAGHMAPVLTAVGATATAALEAATAATPRADDGAAPAWLDYGLDATADVARPLHLLSALQFISGNPIYAEGLLRGAIDRFQTPSQKDRLAPVARPRSAAGAPLVTDTHGPDWWRAADKSLWQTRATAGALASLYGALLLQWDRREREGERLAAVGDACLRGALASVGCTAAARPSLPGVPPRHAAFLLDWLAATAVSTAHVGSFAAALPAALGDAAAAAAAAAAPSRA